TLRREPRRRPRKDDAAHTGQDGAESAVDHADGYAGSATHRLYPRAAHSADAWIVRVLLRVAALPTVPELSGIRSWRDPEGHREAPLHHDRFPRAAPADSARDHFDEQDDAATGATLAEPAPARLCDRHPRRVALLLAGQEGRAGAADLRRHSR